MKKTNHITPEQFIEYPLSQAILMVLEDIKMLEERGIDLYLSSWVDTRNRGREICSVCMGGAALLSFNPDAASNPEVANGADMLDAEQLAIRLGISGDLGSRIADTFDSLRNGWISAAISEWYIKDAIEVEPFRLNTYIGELGIRSFSGFQEDMSEFYTYMTKLSKELEKLGY